MKKFALWTLGAIFILVITLYLAGRFIVNDGDGEPYKTTGIQLRSFSDRIERFKKVCGRYPSTEEGLAALIKNSTTDFCPQYPEKGFIEEGRLPSNVWNKPFHYSSDGITFEIFTYDGYGNKVTISDSSSMGVKIWQ